MGLLGKAITGSAGIEEEDFVSKGGLLKIITQKQNNASKSSASLVLEKTIMEKLSGEFEKYGNFQGILIEAQKNSAEDFSSRLSFIVSSMGLVQGVAPGRCLVLFDAAQDGELIGHHLAKTVPGNYIFCFQAKNPQEAFSFLKPYF